MTADFDLPAIRQELLAGGIIARDAASRLIAEVERLRAENEARQAALVATIMKVRALSEHHRARGEHDNFDGAWAALKIVMESQ